MTREADGRPVPTGHATWLFGAATLFALRVLAQPVAALTGWNWLPAFEEWQSGALPYRWLAASQAVLLAWMVSTAWGVRQGTARPSPARGRLLAAVTFLYGGLMLSRLVLGLTAFRGHWWLDAPLPTVFHLVITTFLGVTAHYHLRG